MQSWISGSAIPVSKGSVNKIVVTEDKQFFLVSDRLVDRVDERGRR